MKRKSISKKVRQSTQRFIALAQSAALKREEQQCPGISKLYYARGIIRRRFHYVNDGVAMQIMRIALSRGASIEQIIEIAKISKNWTAFSSEISSLGQSGVEPTEGQD